MTYRRRLTNDGESILSNGAMRAALTQMTLSWRSTMSNRPTPDDFRAKVFRDREHTGDWRVEKLNDDRESYDVTIFSGAEARERAIRYADREYAAFYELELELELEPYKR